MKSLPSITWVSISRARLLLVLKLPLPGINSAPHQPGHNFSAHCSAQVLIPEPRCSAHCSLIFHCRLSSLLVMLAPCKGRAPCTEAHDWTLLLNEFPHCTEVFLPLISETTHWSVPQLHTHTHTMKKSLDSRS